MFACAQSNEQKHLKCRPSSSDLTALSLPSCTFCSVELALFYSADRGGFSAWKSAFLSFHSVSRSRRRNFLVSPIAKICGATGKKVRRCIFSCDIASFFLFHCRKETRVKSSLFCLYRESGIFSGRVSKSMRTRPISRAEIGEGKRKRLQSWKDREDTKRAPISHDSKCFVC